MERGDVYERPHLPAGHDRTHLDHLLHLTCPPSTTPRRGHWAVVACCAAPSSRINESHRARALDHHFTDPRAQPREHFLSYDLSP